jgi:SOS-response transcriptional repressor LexA
MAPSTTVIPSLTMRQGWIMTSVGTAKGLGKFLEDHRKGLKDTPRYFSQEDVANDLQISQAYVSRLENGGLDRTIPKWPAERQYLLLRVYKFTEREIGEIAHKFHLDRLIEYLHLIRRQPSTHLGVAEGPRVRYMGLVSAGAFGDSYQSEDATLVSVPDWIAERYDLEDIFAVDVTGESMTCDQAKRTIPEGSRVYFHAKLRPEVGEIVCCRLLDRDNSVIKVFKPSGAYTTLESYNRDHKPLILDESNPAQLEGVYLTHIPRPSRLR